MMMLKATRNNWTTTSKRSGSGSDSQSGIPWTRRPSRVVTMAPPPSIFSNYNYNNNHHGDDIYSIGYNTTYNNKRKMMTVMLFAMASVAFVAMIVNVHFARNPSTTQQSPPSSFLDDTDEFDLTGAIGSTKDDEKTSDGSIIGTQHGDVNVLQAENLKAQLQALEFAMQSGSVERKEYAMAKKRYLLSNPPGHRQHPSYYSHVYMRQGGKMRSHHDENNDVETYYQTLTQQYGAWTLVDDKLQQRPVDKFLHNLKANHDWPLSKFPDGAWQTDSDYLSQFLPAAIGLTVRTKQAILQEYGLPPGFLVKQQHDDNDDMASSNNPFAMQFFNAATESFPHQKHGNVGPLNQGGWMSVQTMASLKRRLLHAVMTQGSFTVATVGHNAAAGHGNHFQQSYVLQAGRILEPIFARLGAKGKAHNLAVGVETGHAGTLPLALGANDIIGPEIDVLIWDAKDADSQDTDIGLFATQTLLSGRAPVLMFAQNVHPVMQTLIDSNKETFQGAIPLVRLGSGTSILDHLEEVNTEQDADAQQPWATRYLKCGSNISHYCQVHTYNGTCWLKDRSTSSTAANYLWDGDLQLPSFTPPTRQQAHPPDRVGWNPGWRRHLLQSRVLTYTILQALHEALLDWQGQPNHLLPDDAWHVTNHYKQISTAISQSTATDQWCINKNLPLAFCRVVMHARTEYTPRNLPWSTSLRSIIKAAGVVPQSAPNAYDPPDVDNPYLQVHLSDASAVDVLAIVENGVDFQPSLARIQEATHSEHAYSLAQQAATAAQTTGQSVNPAIQGGFGWELHSVASDNCDGAYDSFCNRGPANDCLLAGYNDGKYGLLFDGYSGWMVFSLNMAYNKQGVIVVSMNDEHASRLSATEGWCSENNTKKDCPSARGRRLSSENHHRQQHRRELETPLAYCADFRFQFAINGQITTWDLAEFQQQQLLVQKEFNLWTLASGGQDDEHTKAILSNADQTAELAIRTTGCGRDKVLELTHIYWA